MWSLDQPWEALLIVVAELLGRFGGLRRIDLGQMAVEPPPVIDVALRQIQQDFGLLRIRVGEHRVACFVVGIVFETNRWRLGIQLEWVLALGFERGVEAEEGPMWVWCEAVEGSMDIIRNGRGVNVGME